METLKAIKDRIRTVESVIKATKAMKMVATVKLSKLNRAPLPDMNCLKILENLLARAVHEANFEQLIGPEDWLVRKNGKKLLIIFSMDQGFCGSFNQSIIEKSRKTVESIKPDYIEVFGKKARFLGKGQLESQETSISRSGVQELSRSLSKMVSEYIKEYGVSEVTLVSGEFKNVLTQKAKTTRIFPLGTELQEEFEYTEIEGDKLDFIFETFKIYLTKFFATAIREHLISEYSARVMAMDNSVRNANEMFEKLGALYNRIRQGKITQELTEIVSSVECVQ